jgi:PilZ domain
MTIVVLPALLLAMVFGMALMSNRRSPQRGADEEFAHAAALERRLRATRERRREKRIDVSRDCTAAVLGEEETRTRCRVLDISRAGMRIATTGALDACAQVIVEWDHEFFVGAVCHRNQKDGEFIFGLSLVSTNCRNGGFEI